MRPQAKWLFIFWQMFWLNILIPGHTRGVITMPGGKSSCCAESAERSSCCSPMGTPAKGKAPTEDQKRRCAICYFAMGYTVATAFVFDLGISSRVIERLETVTPQLRIVEFALPFYPVGPPALS